MKREERKREDDLFNRIFIPKEYIVILSILILEIHTECIAWGKSKYKPI